MSEIELKTAKYIEALDENQNSSIIPAIAQPGEYPHSAGASINRAIRWISLGIGGAAILCLVLLAVPWLKGIGLPKSANVMDWWLWLGGAKSDQTFEKALRDSAAKNQQEWEEKYKQSPMYQFKGIQPIDMNPMPGGQFNWQPQSPARSR
ncbi:MAG TPA: hypothetical protein VMJ32_13640 [Pirellulales bacterium]|nr:hypothetical protein [Pirellulales bacterium]